jgi:hypothetical protein
MQLSENSLASDSGEQETGIQVDLDSDDPKKSVTRVRPRAAATNKPRNWGQERADTSKEVKKRLDRIQRTFQQQRAEDQAEFQRQLAERDKRIEALARGGSDAPSADDAQHQTQMDALQEKLIDAQERGDSREAAKITREMSTLDAKFWAAKAAKAGVVDKTNQSGTDKPAAATGGAAAGRQPTKAGVAWAKANGDWWNDTVDEIAIDARAYATSIHQRKLRDGEDPEDPQYFEEIGQMVKRRFPELDVKAAVRRRAANQIDDPDEADGEDETLDMAEHRNPRRAAPPSLPNRGAVPRGSRNIQTLSHNDIRTMKEVGLNPDDNKHVVEFLRSKNEVEAES